MEIGTSWEWSRAIPNTAVRLTAQDFQKEQITWTHRVGADGSSAALFNYPGSLRSDSVHQMLPWGKLR